MVPLPRTLAAARRDLENSKPNLRVETLRDLGQQGKGDGWSERVELVKGALADAHPAVRRAAAVALADLDAQGAVPDLLPLLSDPDIPVRQMVVLALGELSEPSDAETVGRLLSLCRAGDARIRYQALAGYAGLCGVGARQEILRAAEDADAELRELAIRLARERLVIRAENRAATVDQEVRHILVRAAEDPARGARLAAQLGCLELSIAAPLGEVMRLLQGRMRPHDPGDELCAILLSGEKGVEEARPILTRRGFGWFGWSLDPYRWPIRAALARLGSSRAVASLERGLRAKSWLTRTLAVDAVGQAGVVALRAELEALRGLEDQVDQDILSKALGRLEARAVGLPEVASPDVAARALDFADDPRSAS